MAMNNDLQEIYWNKFGVHLIICFNQDTVGYCWINSHLGAPWRGNPEEVEGSDRSEGSEELGVAIIDFDHADAAGKLRISRGSRLHG